jgi:hypothetical protein
MVITAAEANASNVVGLVYIFACAPDNGEALGELDKRMPVASDQADILPYAEGFLWLDPKDFSESFGQDSFSHIFYVFQHYADNLYLPSLEPSAK